MSGEKPVVLIVDDEVHNLDLLDRTLRRHFTVHRAQSGEEALALLPSLPSLAVIITDQRMPGLTGTQLLKQARVHKPEAVRVIVTGFTQPSDLVDAINSSNVFRFLTKPFDPKQLLAVVRRAYRVYRAGGGYMVDEVTGLANRGLLRRELEREVARAQRRQLLVTLVCARVVGFDACVRLDDGASAEDLMETLAREMERQIRSMDLLGSYGDGVLLAVLPDCGADAALQARLQRAADRVLAAHGCKAALPELAVDLRLAHYPGDGLSVDALLGRLELA